MCSEVLAGQHALGSDVCNRKARWSLATRQHDEHQRALRAPQYCMAA